MRGSSIVSNDGGLFAHYGPYMFLLGYWAVDRVIWHFGLRAFLYFVSGRRLSQISV